MRRDPRAGAMQPLAVDDRLALAPLVEADSEELYALVDAERERLREWLPWVDDARSPDDTRAFVRAALAQLARGDGFHLGVRLDGRLVGVLGLHAIHPADLRTSVGYWLARDATGRGVMTRSLARLLDHVFGELGLHRVELRCATGNRASCAVARRLGFTLEGVARGYERVGGAWLDMNVFSMLAHEWRARGGAIAA